MNGASSDLSLQVYLTPVIKREEGKRRGGGEKERMLGSKPSFKPDIHLCREEWTRERERGEGKAERREKE